MKKQLPKNILVIGIMRYTNNGEIVDTLKEFFKGIPHIDCTEENNRQSVVYVVQDNYCVRKLAHKFFSMGCKDKMIDYSFYVLMPGSSAYATYHTYTHGILPKFITFNSNNVKKLLSMGLV